VLVEPGRRHDDHDRGSRREQLVHGAEQYDGDGHRRGACIL
jgi:hypothetical protein